MLLRLLSETGVVGTTAFALFLGAHYSGFRALSRSLSLGRRAQVQVTPNAVLIAAVSVALLGDSFSLDTFALPQLWVSLSLLSAGASQLNIAHETRSNATAVW